MKKIANCLFVLLCVILSCFALAACGSIPITEVKLDKTSLEISMGQEIQLVAEVMPDNATNKKIIWSTSDPEIATVDEKGNVTGVDEGFVYITAASEEDETIYAECEVTVKSVTYTVRFMVDGQPVSTQTVKQGQNAAIPIDEPIKVGHVFEGWFTAATGGTRVTSVEDVRANADYYAQFTESNEPVNRSFIYEAEHTNLFGVSGAGASGGGAQREMVIPEGDASGGRVVGYTYSEVTLTFLVWADIAASSDLYIRLSSDAGSITLDPGTFEVKVNNLALDFDDLFIYSDDTRPFTEFKLGKINLVEGLNTITVKVFDESPNGVLVDYLKFNTSAILTWHRLEEVIDTSTPGYPQPPTA